MKDANPFQMMLMGLFAVFIVLGVLAFAGILPGFAPEERGRGGDEEVHYGTVQVWGVASRHAINEAIDADHNERPVDIYYTEIKPAQFRQRILEAVANGVGPDLVILPHDHLSIYSENIRKVPLELYKERQYRDTYIEAAEVYLDTDGIWGLPVSIDPMVLYWNRDLFSEKSIVLTPQVWEDMRVLASAFVEQNRETGAIEQAMIPMGAFRNIEHAKEIIAMLTLQTGAKIAYESGGKYIVSFEGPDGANMFANALTFYMEFSDPLKEVYTWNRTLPPARDQFIAGVSAMYLGFASELDDIQRTNPHLNFDIAPVPQIRDSEKKITYGSMNGVSMLDTTKNYDGAIRAMFILASAEYDEKIAETAFLPPVHRLLLAESPDDPYQAIFHDAAISARVWSDPSAEETDVVFGEAIEGMQSGRFNAITAASFIKAKLQKIR